MSLFAKEYLLIHTKVFYGLGEVKIRLRRDFNNKKLKLDQHKITQI